ncbi:hypothetical protein [uncultured Desulfobacter sp.]|uniref:hypothetical protein n=1 Tax=uncultured Desulfobacter sp. TaxID=240139 RepID=UPI0029C8C0C7|nr:hypothetical protein [uncultured Desulfobacter sp.]
MKSIQFVTIPALLFILNSSFPGIGSAVPAASAGHIIDAKDASDTRVQISIKEFLSTAFEDPSLSPQNERIRFLKKTGGISFIENPEFRFTIDKFESNQQKYVLRFKPRGWDEIKGERTVLDARVKSEAIQLESLLHMALKNRYMTVVDFIYFKEMRTLYEALNLLYEDWEHVLKRQVDTPDFDAGELADMENQRLALQMDIMELKNQQDALAKRVNIQSGYTGNVFLDIDHPLPVGQLVHRILAIQINPEDENIYLTRAKSQVAKTEALYLQEVAEKKRLISFVETAYNAADEDDFEDAFSIEFGISIPIGSGSRDTLRQRKLESMKSRSQQHALECEIRQKIPIIRQKLHHQIEQYTAFQQKKTNSFSTAAFERLLQTKGTDPLTLLKFRKSMLGTDILQAKLSHRIFITYIEFLDITGKLDEKPLMNYLSPDEKEGLVQ